jgi:hypothetical protein
LTGAVSRLAMVMLFTLRTTPAPGADRITASDVLFDKLRCDPGVKVDAAMSA